MPCHDIEMQYAVPKDVSTTPVAGGGSASAVSVDPNALVGPAGFGTPNFIQDKGNLPYTVDFENDGTVAAQVVTVTEQLDSQS